MSDASVVRLALQIGKKPTEDFGKFVFGEPGQAVERIAQLFDDLERGRKSPSIFAENVGSMLRDEMARRQRMPSGQYLAFAAEITNAIQRALLTSPPIFRDLYAFLPTLAEVWIACEPTLDLIQFSEAYSLLKTQLGIAERVVYFQADPTHHTYLVQTLRKEGVEELLIAKLLLCRISEPYRQPVALYLRSGLPTVGFVAPSPPPVKRREGGYYLERPVPRDWMRYLSEIQTDEHERKLREYLAFNNI